MTTMNDSMMPIQGATVVTSDHEILGTVKEIVGDCFKVDAPLAPDYWLASDVIASSSGDSIILRLMKDDISDVKMGIPDHHTGLHRHAA